MANPRILLVDDHAMFRSGLAMLLRMGIEPLDLVEARSLNEPLSAAQLAPDVVLLDVLLDGENGLDGIAEMTRKWPHTKVIVVSSDASVDTMQTAMSRGAFAFVSKAESAEKILTVVRQAVPSDSRSPLAQTTAPPLDPTVAKLTPRQLEVIVLLSQGLRNKAIGRRLDVSENTVRWHVQAILSALGVKTRSEAAFAARKLGLIS